MLWTFFANFLLCSFLLIFLQKEDCEFDDTSSSDSSDQSRRGKVLLFKKQLEQVKQKLDKKEKECQNLTESFERRINDLELQLNEKNILISTLADAESKEKTPETPIDKSPKVNSLRCILNYFIHI